MRISLEWLGQYLRGPSDAKLDAKTAADALTHAGLTVDAVEAFGDDTVLDVEVTSNRSDCLCHIGVACELAALLKLNVSITPPTAAESDRRAEALASVRIDAADLCPHYTARIIQGVKIGPSPAWMARRLEAVGVRPINNVVDATNYVMFEMGQPLHAFDFDRLDGAKIIVRRAQASEKLVSIDGKERPLAPGMLVIADARRPVALAGVMGGRDTEVSDSTVNLLLESARFDPLSVRRTARALVMGSPSSYRFERGIDPTLPPRASLRAAELILETAGGRLLAGSVDAGAADAPPKTLSLRLPTLKRVLGIDVPAAEAMDVLGRLNFSPRLAADRIDVTVPSARLDIRIEVDLVEEVARVIGYSRIPTRPHISIQVVAPDPAARALSLLRDVLVGAGFYEAVTFSFVSDLLAGDFLEGSSSLMPRADAAVRRADGRLRPSIIPGLLEAVARNENAGNASARLFEIGSTFRADAAGRIEERRRLGLVAGTDLREARGVVEEVLSRLDAARAVTVVPDQHIGYASGACGRILWGGQTVGRLGKISAAVAAKLSLRQVPAAAELDVEPLLAGAQLVPQLKPLPRFPAVRRDLSLVVPEAMAYAQLESLIEKMQPDGLEQVEYVTTYRGRPLDAGRKSITVTLVFRSPSGTLTSEQVEESVRRIVDAAAAQLGAALRT